MSDKTYAETQGQPAFDWRTTLDKAINRDLGDGLNEDEHEALIELAQGWVTCACGNQCAIIPRDINGQPRDENLIRLGARFFYAIEDGEWEYAKEVLEQIEARSDILIKQELAILKEQHE